MMPRSHSRHFKSFISLLSFVLLASSLSPARGDDLPSIQVVLELPDWDSYSVGPREVVEKCSRALTKREGLSKPVLAQLLVKRGLAYGVLGKPDLGKADLDEALKVITPTPSLKIQRVNLMLLKGEIDEAKTELETILQASPECSPAYVLLAAVALDRQDYKRAIALADQAIHYDSHLGLAFYQRAQARLYLRQFRDSAIDYARAHDLDPVLFAEPESMYQLYLARGHASKEEGHLQQAAANYQMARKMDPTALLPLGGLWGVHWLQGRYAVCEYLADEMLRLHKTNPLAFVVAATTQNALAHPDAARRYAEKALALDPESLDAMNELGIALYHSGEYEEALSKFDKVLGVDPNNALALASKGYIYSTCPEGRIRNGTKGLECAKRACQLRQYENSQFLSTLAAAHAECGDFENAVKSVQQALQLLAKQGARSSEMEASLKLFRAKQPLRDRPQRPSAQPSNPSQQ